MQSRFPLPKKPTPWALLAMLSLISVACALFTPTVGPEPPQANPTPTRGAQPPLAPANTTAVITPDPYAWPPSQELPYPDAPLDFADYAETLRAYLAAGGPPGTLVDILNAWNAAPQTGEPLIMADLRHNGQPEIIVSFIHPHSTGNPPEATIAIYAGREGSVQTLYTYRPGKWFGLNLIGAEDLTQDDQTDLIFAEISCGDTTCWHTLHVWSWSAPDFQEHIGAEFTYPYPNFGIRNHNLVVSSGNTEPQNAGPQRPITTTLAWSGETITVSGHVPGPAIYRYHAFRDGDTALLSGDYAQARASYQQTLNDAQLEHWAIATSSEEERKWLAALAHWRLLLLDLLTDNHDNAQMHYARLASDYPVGTAGHAVAEIALEFWSTYQDNTLMGYSCLNAIESSEAQTVLDFLNNFGYANAAYNREDLCPFLEP